MTPPRRSRSASARPAAVAKAAKPPPGMRLQRFLALAGIAARRKAEQLITSGQVTVNGQVVTELGTRVDPNRDQVYFAERRVLAERPVYILLNKPRGYVTTAEDPDGRPTVMALVKSRERLFPVGRLDYTTEGALLLTNDGDLAFALMHPSRGVEKTYHVKLQGMLSDDDVRTLRDGVTLDDGEKTAPADVRAVALTEKNTWLEITLREGKNRQIHRMAEAINRQVLKLQRVLYAGLSLDGIKPGYWRRLADDEVAALRELSNARTPPQRKHAAPPLRRPGPAPRGNGRPPVRKYGAAPAREQARPSSKYGAAPAREHARPPSQSAAPPREPARPSRQSPAPPREHARPSGKYGAAPSREPAPPTRQYVSAPARERSAPVGERSTPVRERSAASPREPAAATPRPYRAPGGAAPAARDRKPAPPAKRRR